jgi:hypothetical protein
MALTNAVRIKRADGTWQDIAIQGATGPAGATGPVGPTGAPGATGPQGPQATPPKLYSTGPQPGSGGTLAASVVFTDSGVPARQLIIPAQTVISRARVTWKTRWDVAQAIWSWAFAGIAVSPAPVAGYDGGQTATGNDPARTIIWGASNAVPYQIVTGTFYMDLAVSQAYTLSHYLSTGVGSWTWDNTSRYSLITAEVYPR